MSLSSVHLVFYVFMLRKCVGDLSLVVPIEDIGVKDLLYYDEIPVEILEREVQILRTKEIASVKVLWSNQKLEEATLEFEENRKAKYSFLFPVLDESV